VAQKENLAAEPGALAVLARAADGSLRDGLSLLEQARAYCGENIKEIQVRELLGLASGEVLGELVGAIEVHSARRVLALVHKLLAEGQNLQHFCREAISHFRNLLVAKVCGVNSDLIAAPAEERPQLARAAAAFSEEDLTRCFQILLRTDDDMRRKPDPRLHLEMGLLRLVNAARLAPIEEVIAELSGNAAPRPRQPADAGAQAPAPNPSAVSASAPARPAPPSVPPAPQSFAARAAGNSPAVSAEPLSRIQAPSTPPVSTAPTPASEPNGPAASFAGIDAAQVAAIKSTIASQQKFLAELVEHAHRWELDGGEIRLYFPTENRSLAELLQARESLEKLRTIASRVLGQPLRVCVKLDAGPVPVLGNTVRADQTTRDLRARFEQDPIVQGMLERFGGRISEVKARGEE
jgi:DNA polymerase-3 subunit gamma/tau